MEKVQLLVQNSVQFKTKYKELIAECVARRKSAGFTQDFMAEWLEVDRRKIIQLEAGNGGAGLLLNYADRLDIETKFEFIKH